MNIGFLITARLKSSRLPMKLLKNLGEDNIIGCVIDRISLIDEPLKTVLCTSTNNQDLPLIEIARNKGIYYFNGNEEDVLERLLVAAKLHGLDYLIGITGENPLFCLKTTKEIIDLAKENKYDFIYPIGLPIGSATYALKIKALETVCKIKKVVDTEIWGYLINRPEVFAIKNIKVSEDLCWPELRITCDYTEDYKFLQAIWDHTSEEDRMDLGKVLTYLKANTGITDIHSDRIQLDLDKKVKKEIDDYYISNLDEILKIKKEIYDIR